MEYYILIFLIQKCLLYETNGTLWHTDLSKVIIWRNNDYTLPIYAYQLCRLVCTFALCMQNE